MDANSKAQLVEAVNVLVEDTAAKTLFKQLEWVVELARKGVSVGLTGSAAVLNPILQLWITDEPTFDRVLELVERKRAERGLDPLTDSQFDRRVYMRELMAAKRQRLATLVRLVNELRSPKDRIRGSTRMEFERVHASRWLTVREERELAMRDKLGRRLSLAERQSIISQLWADVDTELAELESFVIAEEKKPLHQRAPNGYKFKLQPKKEIR